MKTGLLLLSHGEFAKAALASAEMITGHQEQVIALALTEDKMLETLCEELQEAYHTLAKENDQILAICDIYGGTPFNALLRVMLGGSDMVAYTGLSLPLLIDVLMSRDFMEDVESLKEHMEQTQKEVLKEIILPSMDEEDEEE